jgi:hypothetical protein
VGGVNIGLVYSHGFASEEDVFFGTVGKVLIEGDLDSGGGYVAKQFDCGFKLGATWAYSAGELRLKDAHRPFSEFDTFGASGALGFARSFGDKKNWRNAFVDTSANFLFQSEEDAWSFLWMAKVGHNCCERFAVYGLFNLYHKLDYRGRFVVSPVFAGYRPYGDDTWGETGGGFQARLWRGLTFTAEATTPVLDEGLIASNAFQVRAAFHWRF